MTPVSMTVLSCRPKFIILSLIESESRGCPRFKASKGEAVVNYREPLATQKMGYHRLSRRANKMEWFFDILYFTDTSVSNSMDVI